MKIEETPSTTTDYWVKRRKKMPLTESGKDVLSQMQDEYGDEKGKEVFNASINKGKKGSEKWHEKGKLRREGHKKNLRKETGRSGDGLKRIG